MIAQASYGFELGDLLIKRGIGVRALGMGGVYTAVANDASAIFYNQAGLAEVGLGYTYGSLDSQQVKHEFGFSALKLGFLGYSEGKVTDLTTGDEVVFSAIGFGNRTGWLNWGSNFKSLEWTMSGVKNDGWTADLGVLIRITPQPGAFTKEPVNAPG